MATVMTVRGPIRAKDLGVVDYHEHLCFDAPAWLLREDRDFRLDDPELFARDRAAFDKALQALGDVQKKLDDAEDRWLELEILREELSGSE